MLLSICIPTYNFGDYIGETLNSICNQITEDVEIVILDGGSQDRTEIVVQTWQDLCPAIRYVRQAERGGIDRDMARVVELAKGDYCWLFSADDIMIEQSITRVLRQIRLGYDLFLCTHMETDAGLKVVQERYPVLDAPEGSIFDFSDKDQRRSYFERALTTEAFFSFLGGIIVRREAWLSEEFPQDFQGSCWAHVVRLLTLLNKGVTLKFVKEPMLMHRGGNDSFSDKGLVFRTRIGVEGFHKIADSVFSSGSFEALSIRRALLNEYSLKHFIKVKYYAACHPEESNQDLSALVLLAYSDKSTLNLLRKLAFFATPPALLRSAGRLRNSAREWLGKRAGAKEGMGL